MSDSQDIQDGEMFVSETWKKAPIRPSVFQLEKIYVSIWHPQHNFKQTEGQVQLVAVSFSC